MLLGIGLIAIAGFIDDLAIGLIMLLGFIEPMGFGLIIAPGLIIGIGLDIVDCASTGVTDANASKPQQQARVRFIAELAPHGQRRVGQRCNPEGLR